MNDFMDVTSSSSSDSCTDSLDPDIIIVSDSESVSNVSSTSIEILEDEPSDVIDLDKIVDSNENINNSVITIKDSMISDVSKDFFILDTTPDFIPIDCSHNNPRKRKRKGKRKPKNQKKLINVVNCASNTIESSKPILNVKSGRKEKFSKTPIIQLSYPNILNDNAVQTQMVGLRPIIIDGCNVGFGYGNGNFMMRGIILVIQYFKNRGHDEIVCFLPQHFRHKIRSPSEERTVDRLEKENMFSITPSRHLENGKRYTPYDDRYIVQYATERQGIIISNDGYRDLIEEESSWRETIENRIINYTFARGMFMLPKDPCGPNGPTLDEMLKFP